MVSLIAADLFLSIQPPTQTSIYRLSTIENDSRGRSFITFEEGKGEGSFSKSCVVLGLGFRRSFSNK